MDSSKDSSAQSLQRACAPQAGCTALIEKVDRVSRVQAECTIYRVHRHLRDVNRKAYEPEVIAIGPYHRNKEHLKMMEAHKLRNLQLFKDKRGCNIVEMYEAVGRLESEARKCYADQPIGLTKSAFIEMLILDGCFIAELVWKFTYDSAGLKNDPIFRMDWMMTSLKRDLMLFENQVPFFILCELFDLIKYPEQGITFTLPELLLNFFRDLYPGQRKPNAVVPQEASHVLDLIHRSWFRDSNENESLSDHELIELQKFLDEILGKNELRVIDCASVLRQASVEFKKNDARLLDVEFKNGVMRMTPLTVHDWTESLLRNLIAYEQYFEHHLVTDYVTFLNSLINSGKDVEVLTRNDIIVNMQGDDEVVAQMVNRLGDSVTKHTNRFFYAQICKNVKEHSRKPWNLWMAKLRRNYLSSPWAIISVFAAALLLLLAITQTAFTILQF